MEYTESPAQAIEYAKRALEEMRLRRIDPHPNNFAVWYVYVSGRMPDLNRAIGVLDDAGEAFSDARNAEIFDRFLSTAKKEAAVAEATGKLTDQMTHVLDNMSVANQGADAYGEALGKAINSLGKLDAEQEAKSTIAEALEQTRHMAALNRALEKDLRNSSDEIGRLREDLESLRQEAYTDGLTGIANRKRFDQALRQCVMTAMEDGSALCLMMIDIDYFKQFNDTYGHQIGDEVLRLLAKTLRENVKGQDTPARYGGEEFAIILPNTQLENAMILAEQIRTAISSKKVRNRRTGEDLGQITISIGVSAFVFGESLNQFVGRADGAMYMAKNSGRNRVCSDRDLKNPELSFSA